MCIEKPFYTKWKGRLKLRGVELAGSQPGLSLYSELLQERYDVFKEHQPAQPSTSNSMLEWYIPSCLCCFFLVLCNIILTSLAFIQFVKAADRG